MTALWQLVRKELLVLRRDWHALALLFVMPTAFIVLMSLALRDVFSAGRGTPFTYHLVNHDVAPESDSLAAAIRRHEAFRDLGAGDDTALLDDVRHDRNHFLVVIPAGFSQTMMNAAPRPVAISSAPGVDAATRQLFEAAVREAASRVYVQRAMEELTVLLTGLPTPPGARKGPAMDGVERLVAATSLYGTDGPVRRRTSVQQNVPAWLIFSMFFVALPLSTTWLQERRQGTLAKLRSLGLAPQTLLAGKVVPYVAINLVQVALMLAVGVWLVPLLGGDALTLGHSVAGLVVMSLAVSAAAVSYGLLIANLVSTTEQATILTGVSNLLLALLGGVMVPRVVMPEAMQRLSALSPMSWGLEGFLDVMLRDGDLRTVAPRALLLAGFAVMSLVLGALLLRRPRVE